MFEALSGGTPATLSLMRLGFEASVLFNFWSGSANGLTDYGVKIPNGIMLQKKQRIRLKFIENATRNNLEKYSYKIQDVRFLPFKTYKRWKLGYEKFKREFQLERDQILADYDFLSQNVRKEAELWISDVYKLISGTDRNAKPPLSFSENLVAKILSKAPKKKDLANLFKYKVVLMPYVGLGSSVYDVDKWVGSTKWEEIAKEGIELSATPKDDLLDLFPKAVAIQYAEKCRGMFQDLLDVVSTTDINWKNVRTLNRALDDAEALNFFEDKKISEMILKLKTLIDKTRQRELEIELSEFLSYVNIECGKNNI